MKNAERHLQTTLTESLQHTLSNLNEKHAKKLQKTIARAAKQLARTYVKLAAKELKSSKKATPKAAATVHALPKPAVRATRTAAKRPVAAHVAAKA